MLRERTDHELIILNPLVKNKSELFDLMSNYLAEKEYVSDSEAFSQSLINREKAGNTEIMPNIAIPHAGCRSVKGLFLLIVILKEGIDYEHPAFGPVRLLFLFGCDNKHNKNYLRLLARTARLLKNENFTRILINAESSTEVLNTLAQYDKDTDEETTEDSYLMLVYLYKTGKLPDVLTAMMEIGIHNASVIKSLSMARKIAYDMPVFSGLSMRHRKKNLETALIISNVNDRRIPHRLSAILKEYEIDFTKPGYGYIQLFPTEIVAGTLDEFS